MAAEERKKYKREWVKGWRRKNRERFNKNARRYQKENREKIKEQNILRLKEKGMTLSDYGKLLLQRAKKSILDHYGWKCNCCGETTPQFLTIDHVNNDGFKDKNNRGKKITGYPLYARIIRENFPERYQILCMNCNHGKRMNMGTCPHKAI